MRGEKMIASHPTSSVSPDAPEEFQQRGAPWISTEDVPECPVCGRQDHHPYATGFDYELLTCRNPWNLVQCSACAHVWLHPRPAVQELSVIYPRTYYAYNYGNINPVARKAKEWLDRRKMGRIIRHCAQPPKSYLDVGCGDGRFLRVLEGLGVSRRRLYGLELDSTVVDRLRSQGYEGVFCERVESCASIPDRSIDLATMFHVIEHVDDPGAVIRQVRRWLVPGGIFAMETPNLDSLDARLFQKTYWGGYHIPRHWNLFTPETVSRLLQDNGLEVLATTYQTGHSFWMYSLHHWIRYQGASRPRLGAWFDPMKSLLGIGAFTAFDLARGFAGARTSAMLVICRAAA